MKRQTVKTDGASDLEALSTVMGETDDAAVTTDAAGTISAKLRGLIKWAYERMPSSLGQAAMTACFPVVLANDHSDIKVTLDGEEPNVAARGQTATLTATIANGESLSDEIDLAGYTLVGIHMPSDWTAASLTFAVAFETGGTFYPLYDDAGNEVELTADAQQAIGVCGDNAVALAPWCFLKVRSGTSGTPAAQGAERVITLAVKG